MHTEAGVPRLPAAGHSFDLSDPAAYAAGSAHAEWRRLRQTEPVRLEIAPSGVPYWSFFSYRDCESILKDTATFSSASGTILASIGVPDPAGGRTLVLADPPDHTRMRRLAMHHLGPAAVRRRYETIRHGVSRLVKSLTLGEHDVMPTLRILPMIAIGPMTGLPEKDWESMVFHATGCIAPDDPAFTRGGTDETLLYAHSRLFHMIDAALRDGGANADGSLAAGLRSLAIGDRPMGRRDVMLNFYSTLIGGNTTTPHVAAHLLLRLAEQPELWEQVLDEPALVPALVEEGVRWTTPTHSLVRRVTSDVEIGGTRLHAGDWVSAWVASANRDESVFAAPYEFDPRRSPNPHLGFGRGAHFCIGTWAARSVLGALIEGLAERGLRFRLAGEPQHLKSNAINGITSMPMRFF